MADAGPVVADLRAESAELDSMVAELSDQQWRTATPAPGWTIAHQIAHLWWTDRVAWASATDEVAFGAVLAEAGKDPLGFVDAGAVLVGAVDLVDGIGRQFVQAAITVDLNTVMAVFVITSLVTLLCNLLADLSYSLLDPRIRVN